MELLSESVRFHVLLDANKGIYSRERLVKVTSRDVYVSLRLIGKEGAVSLRKVSPQQLGILDKCMTF